MATAGSAAHPSQHAPTATTPHASPAATLSPPTPLSAVLQGTRKEPPMLFANEVDLVGLYRALHRHLDEVGPNAKNDNAVVRDVIEKHYVDIYKAMKHDSAVGERVLNKKTLNNLRSNLHMLVMRFQLHRVVDDVPPTTQEYTPSPLHTADRSNSDDDEDGTHGSAGDPVDVSADAATARPAHFLRSLNAAVDKAQKVLASENLSVGGINDAKNVLAEVATSVTAALADLERQQGQKIFVLGETGIGKSMALNSLLMFSEQHSDRAAVAPTSVGAEAQAKWLALCQEDDDCTAMELPITEPPADAGQAIDQERIALNQVRSMAYSTTTERGAGLRYSFLLPVATTTIRAVTSHAIHVLHAPTYQLLVRFYTKESFLSMLQLAQEKLQDPRLSDDEKDTQRRCLCDGVLSCETDAAGNEVGVVFANAMELQEAVKGTAPIELTSLVFSAAAKEILRTPAQLFAGTGRSLTLDRMFIRHRLGELTLHGPSKFLVRDVFVFAPCAVLAGGQELVDCPGLGDGDMFKIANVTDCMETAESVLIMVDKELQTRGATFDFVRRYLAHRLLRKTQGGSRNRFQAHVIGLLERQDQNPLCVSHFEDPNLTVHVRTAMALNQQWASKSREQLRRLFEGIVAGPSFSASNEHSQQDLVNDALKRIEFLPFRPVLWSSVMSCPAQFLESSEASLRALALSGGHRLFAALESIVPSSFTPLMRLRDALESRDGVTKDQALRETLGGTSSGHAEALHSVESVTRPGYKVAAAAMVGKKIVDELNDTSSKFLSEASSANMYVAHFDSANVESCARELAMIPLALNTLGEQLRGRLAAAQADAVTNLPLACILQFLQEPVKDAIIRWHSRACEYIGLPAETINSHLDGHAMRSALGSPEKTVLSISGSAFLALVPDNNRDRLLDFGIEYLKNWSMPRRVYWLTSVSVTVDGLSSTLLPTKPQVDAMAHKVIRRAASYVLSHSYQIKRARLETKSIEDYDRFVSGLISAINGANGVNAHLKALLEGRWKAFVKAFERTLSHTSISRRSSNDLKGLRPLELWQEAKDDLARAISQHAATRRDLGEWNRAGAVVSDIAQTIQQAIESLDIVRGRSLQAVDHVRIGRVFVLQQHASMVYSRMLAEQKPRGLFDRAPGHATVGRGALGASSAQLLDEALKAAAAVPSYANTRALPTVPASVRIGDPLDASLIRSTLGASTYAALYALANGLYKTLRNATMGLDAVRWVFAQVLQPDFERTIATVVELNMEMTLQPQPPDDLGEFQMARFRLSLYACDDRHANRQEDATSSQSVAAIIQAFSNTFKRRVRVYTRVNNDNPSQQPRPADPVCFSPSGTLGTAKYPTIDIAAKRLPGAQLQFYPVKRATAQDDRIAVLAGHTTASGQPVQPALLRRTRADSEGPDAGTRRRRMK